MMVNVSRVLFIQNYKYQDRVVRHLHVESMNISLKLVTVLLALKELFFMIRDLNVICHVSQMSLLMNSMENVWNVHHTHWLIGMITSVIQHNVNMSFINTLLQRVIVSHVKLTKFFQMIEEVVCKHNVKRMK